MALPDRPASVKRPDVDQMRARLERLKAQAQADAARKAKGAKR